MALSGGNEHTWSSGTTFILAAVGAAVGLYLLVRPGRREPRVVGALIGIGAASWLMVNLPLTLAPDHRPEIMFLLFSVIAVAVQADAEMPTMAIVPRLSTTIGITTIRSQSINTVR